MQISLSEEARKRGSRQRRPIDLKPPCHPPPNAGTPVGAGNRIAMHQSNWRSYLSNLPSAATGEGEEEWVGATPCLRDALVRFCAAAHLTFPCLLPQRGFCIERWHNGPSGDRDCGSRLAFLAKDEWTRTFPG